MISLARLRTLSLLVALSGCRGAPSLGPEVAVAHHGTDWLMATLATELVGRTDLLPATLERIAAVDVAGPRLSAVVALDPDATGGAGRLAGLPILVKDNVDVAGLATTAGSLALEHNLRTEDAFVVALLRREGAILFGKANLSEWANFRGDPSVSGWSAIGGTTRNPYALDRSACGSSSGSAVAVAAGLAAIAIGTETDGSILCPASVNGVVGVKPTVGLVSRSGVVPISPTQDTVGPLARTVADAALALSVMAAVDPSDPACAGRPDGLDTDYVRALDPGALRGARLGVARGLGSDLPAKVWVVFDAALEELRAEGARVVEVDLALDPVLAADEEEVLLHEFRPALEAYLATVPGGPRTLEDLIAFGRDRPEELRWFGQELFEAAAVHPRDGDRYLWALHEQWLVAGALGIDATLAEHELAALVTPTTGPAWPIDPVNGDRGYTGGTSTITAVSGYPAVTVPMGSVDGLPVGLSIVGAAYGEARLLALAYAYERATGHRSPPKFATTVKSGHMP